MPKNDMQDELMGITSRRGQRVPQDVLDSLGKTEMQAKQKFTLFYVDHRFDSESGKTQERDKGGKWTDEGKGSQSPGYEHPSDKAEGGARGAGKGAAGATQPSGTGVDIPSKTAKVTGNGQDISGRVQEHRFIVDSHSDRESFQAGLRRTNKDHPFGAAVQVKEPEFYQNPLTKLYLSEDKLAGVAVAPDLDMVSAFKHPSSTADFHAMLEEASPHAIRGDAFATGDGHLLELYSHYGFKPVVRVKFDEKYKPPGWDSKGPLDMPDVVLMARDPDNKLDLPDVAAKGYKAVENDIPVAKDYGKAQEMQLLAVRKSGLLDKAIADYKPDRSLSDPTKTAPLTKVAPQTSYVPYSQTPFFDRINALQGMRKDPLQYGVKAYIDARDEVFDTLPVEKLKLENVVVTQEMVNKDRVQQLMDHPETGGNKPIQVVREGGNLYILNGHHRVAALLAKGGSAEIEAHVLDLDYPEPTPPKDYADIPRYTRELSQTPEFRSVGLRLQHMGATNGERENWSLRQNTTDGSGDVGQIEKDGTIHPDKLKPERREKWKKWAASFDNPNAVPEPGTRPQAVYLIGPPGAGKSTSPAVIEQIKGVFQGKEFVRHEADAIREKFDEYRGWNTPGTQEEAKQVGLMVADKAIAEHKNLLYDEVGGNIDKLTKRTAALKKAGYDVHVVYVNVPLEETAPRTWKRFLEMGRFTDPGYLYTDVDNKVIDTYNALKANPDMSSGLEIDNSNFAGTLIDKWDRTKATQTS